MQMIHDALAPEKLEQFKRMLEADTSENGADSRIERLREKRAKDADEAEEAEDRAKFERRQAALKAAMEVTRG